MIATGTLPQDPKGEKVVLLQPLRWEIGLDLCDVRARHFRTASNTPNRCPRSGPARIDGKEAAVWNYRAPDGRPLVCVMLVGGMGELPEPDQRLEHEGRPFHAYARSERTIVFWPEGPVLCALIAIGDPAEVIALAKAKAMGPA